MTPIGKKLDGACITREQWLLREMRIVAKLRLEGIDESAITARIKAENLFQYKMERSLRTISRTCNKRIDAVKSEAIVRLVADGMPSVAAQANLYMMMCAYPLVRHFFIEEVARRYEELNYSFTTADMNAYFTRLEAEYENIAKVSELTLTKLKQVLRKCMIECEMLANSRSEDLIPIMIDFDVREAIETKGDTSVLAVYNCKGAM